MMQLYSVLVNSLFFQKCHYAKQNSRSKVGFISSVFRKDDNAGGSHQLG